MVENLSRILQAWTASAANCERGARRGPMAGPKNKNTPTKVRAQFIIMIIILYGTSSVKPKTKIFARFCKWCTFSFLRVPESPNFRHLLISRNS